MDARAAAASIVGVTPVASSARVAATKASKVRVFCLTLPDG
jgi:hypothetical protein